MALWKAVLKERCLAGYLARLKAGRLANLMADLKVDLLAVWWGPLMVAS
jgi:hypothetical protein